jgi:hypothetical protein
MASIGQWPLIVRPIHATFTRQPEMQMPERNTARNLFLLSFIFVLSRIAFYMLGVRFDMSPLVDYWQYPAVESLQQDVLRTLWYQPAQPPLFNLLLAGILKTNGANTTTLFVAIFMAISLANALLLNTIISRITSNRNLALILSLVYLLSPSTVLLENELFYTSFLSLLFLLAVNTLVLMQRRFSLGRASSFFFLLAAICLTRSFYHLLFIIAITGLMVIHWWPAPGCRKLLLAAVLPVCLVTGWYAKNYLLFGKFSTTSWSGMNLARIVFRDKPAADSNSIASIAPFSRVSAYRDFVGLKGLSPTLQHQSPVLTSEYKNGPHLNLFNQQYIEIADKYEQEARRVIRNNPLGYLRNAGTSAIIFFTPASSYFKLAENEKAIRYFDAALTLNFSSFFEPELTKKKTLVLSALFIFLSWLVVLNAFRKEIFGPWQFPAFNFFILLTISYVFLAGTFLEYGENMRFRYEVQPLFLILAAQYITWAKAKRTIPSFQI